MWPRRRRGQPERPAREGTASPEAREAVERGRKAVGAAERRTSDVTRLVRRVVSWEEEDPFAEAFERELREGGRHGD
jgi:hypothetical protein